jgi:hypothetical protein
VAQKANQKPGEEIPTLESREKAEEKKHEIGSEREDGTQSVSSKPVSRGGLDAVLDDQSLIDPTPPPLDISEAVLPPIVPPLRGEASEDVNMITVILRPREDKARDKLLLRRIFGVMISQPGNDRFAFHIFEQGKGHLLEFPNLTTGLCPELIEQINFLVGSDNVRVEPITFQ